VRDARTGHSLGVSARPMPRRQAIMGNGVEWGRGRATLPLVDLAVVHEKRGWFIGLGIALAILGTLAIVLPPLASLATTVVLGFLLIAAGIAEAAHALANRRWAAYGWELAGGIVHLIAGALVVAFPLTGTLALTLVLAVFLLAEGVLRLIRASQHRHVQGNGWLVFDGIVSIALGLLIGVGWPSTAAWALGLLVGVNMLLGGSEMLFIGLAAGRARRANV
jgi:uncharacterized membrane protein HdeD (DUF308 family)